MKLNRIAVLIVIAVLASAALVGVTGMIAGVVNAAPPGAPLAEPNDDGEAPITGEALDKASAAALAHTAGGRVTETEVGDEDGYYEVEVTFDDGRQVDVHLDQAFNVLGQEADHEDPNGQD